MAFVDPGYIGDTPRDEAKETGIELIMVKWPEAKKGFVLLPSAASFRKSRRLII